MTRVRAVASPEGHRLNGEGAVVEAGNQFLDHLRVPGFSPATDGPGVCLQPGSGRAGGRAVPPISVASCDTGRASSPTWRHASSPARQVRTTWASR